MDAHTDNVSHAGAVILFADASRAILSNNVRIVGGAGTVPGRANGALIRDLSPDESFDMLEDLWEWN